MKKYTEAERKAVHQVQAVLLAIANKQNIFFNITVYTNAGLVTRHGKTIDNKTNWVLTEKGKQMLNLSI